MCRPEEPEEVYSRKLDKADFVGKKIVGADCRAVNALTLFFDDGTDLEIEVEFMGHGIYGMATPIKR